LYYLLFVMGAGLARQGAVSPAGGIWISNIVLAILGLSLLPRMEQFRGESHWLRPLGFFKSRIRLLRRRKAQARVRSAVARPANGDRGLQEAGTRDGSSFSAADGLVHSAEVFFVLRPVDGHLHLFVRTFTFFELLDDIARHRVPFLIVVDYFRYLAPYLMYQLAPLGALVAVLVTLGIMSKSNEIIAIKASGMSLYRLAVPLLLAGMALAAIMVGLDDTYLPYANQRQDALRNLIKGRPPQTYTRPQRWIFGEDYKIYNYDVFLPAQNLFGGLSVLEIDPATFQLRRRVFATRADGRISKSMGAGGRVGSRFFGWHHRALRPASSGHLASGANGAAGIFQPRSPAGLSDELAGIERLHRGIASRGV